jgi:hypothetical protein
MARYKRIGTNIPATISLNPLVTFSNISKQSASPNKNLFFYFYLYIYFYKINFFINYAKLWTKKYFFSQKNL